MLRDEEIISLYFEKNETAIEETERKYGKYLFVIAYNIVSDAQDSEECVNDTYLHTWNAIPPKRPHHFRAFLTKTVRRLALDRERKKQAGKRIPCEYLMSLQELEDDIAISTENEAEHLGAVFNDFLRKLPEKSRCIFVSRYYCGDSVETIAHYMKISESAVYKNLTQTKRSLKKLLEKEGFQL